MPCPPKLPAVIGPVLVRYLRVPTPSGEWLSNLRAWAGRHPVLWVAIYVTWCWGSFFAWHRLLDAL